MNILLATILIGQLQVTSYRSVPEQTDSTPFHTATGERVHSKGIAVSQDLLQKNGGPLQYGDLVYVEGVGFKFVFDCMNKRHKRKMDVWVSSLKEEKEFHSRFKHKKLKVWLVRRTK